MKLPGLFFFILLPFFSFSQGLLANGGFEDENICVEYHINCSPEAWISTSDPFNNFFKIPGYAHSGNHCIAIEAGNSNALYKRSYIRTQLLCHLRKGSIYRLSLFAKSRYNILDSTGIYFTSYDFLFEKNIRYRIVPSLYLSHAGAAPVKGDTNWQQFTFDYTATGDEVFMTLGNFSKRDITGSTGLPFESHFYIFFDDVSLYPLNPDEKLCPEWQATKEELYAFDMRHQFLSTYVKNYVKNPPEPVPTGTMSVQVIDTLLLPDVLFESGKSILTGGSYPLLDTLIRRSMGKYVDSLVVEGHTDSTGTNELNERLSYERALTAANYIGQKLQLKREAVMIRAMASTRPVADNRTPAGRQKNRRVEIFIYLH